MKKKKKQLYDLFHNQCAASLSPAVMVNLESSIDYSSDSIMSFFMLLSSIFYMYRFHDCASRLVGTSLLQEIVYLVSQGADPDEIGLMNIDEQLPVLEYPQPGLDIIQVMRLDSALLVLMKLACVFLLRDIQACHQQFINKLLYLCRHRS